MLMADETGRYMQDPNVRDPIRDVHQVRLTDA